LTNVNITVQVSLNGVTHDSSAVIEERNYETIMAIDVYSSWPRTNFDIFIKEKIPCFAKFFIGKNPTSGRK